MGKSYITSKTLWVNFIAFAAITIQGFTGFVIDPTIQGYALAGINMLLRLITKEPLIWK